MAGRSVALPTSLLPTRQIISPGLTNKTILLKTFASPQPLWRSAILRSGSIIAASKTWRQKGTNILPKIIGGVRFQDGIEVTEVPANHAV